MDIAALFSGPGKIAFFGLGGVALFGGVMLFIQKFMGKKSEAREIAHTAVQKHIQTKVEKVTKEQEVIEKQLKQAEVATEESKEKIKVIARKAAVEMNKVLKEDSIAKISDQIDSDWEDL